MSTSLSIDNTAQNINEKLLFEIRSVIASAITESSIAEIADDVIGIIGTGKLLRSRLTVCVGTVADTPANVIIATGAAVELIHAGSLLHDDVIDGGELRRGAPTFWKEKGLSGAILLGDHLVAYASKLVDALHNPKLLSRLIKAISDMCDAEIQQELILRNSKPDWKSCIDIAKRKTGSLFGYAATAAGGENAALCKTLLHAGTLIGTAYQLADDMLDICPDPAYSGKTPGTDAKAGKVTAASACERGKINPQEEISTLYSEASSLLAKWPEISQVWDDYVDSTLKPAIDRCLAAAVGQSAE